MPRPQLQTVALRTRLSVSVCAESPAPDSLVFVQNNGWEWAPSGRKLGGNDRSTDNLPARQWLASRPVYFYANEIADHRGRSVRCETHHPCPLWVMNCLADNLACAAAMPPDDGHES